MVNRDRTGGSKDLPAGWRAVLGTLLRAVWLRATVQYLPLLQQTTSQAVCCTLHDPGQQQS